LTLLASTYLSGGLCWLIGFYPTFVEVPRHYWLSGGCSQRCS
jgi:hypothetical protein